MSSGLSLMFAGSIAMNDSLLVRSLEGVHDVSRDQ